MDRSDHLEIAVALVRKIDKQIRWLGILDAEKKQVDFVVAQRLEKESWRESVTREVAWKLELDRHRDFIVSNMAQINSEFEAVLPGNSETTKIACTFYNVELYRKSTVLKVEQDEHLIWLTSNEICNGATQDGIPLNPLIVLLNEHVKVIQHWESDTMEE